MHGYNPSHSKELALPDGSVEVVFELLQDNIRLFDNKNSELVLGRSVLCGPHADYFVIDTAQESKAVGIHFKPGGMRPFLKEPLDQFLNTHVALDVVWGATANEIREELLAASVPEEMFRTLERRLLTICGRTLERHPAVQHVVSNLHNSQIGELIEQTGMSHRRFNQLFKEEVGMTPKRLGRLHRLQHALSMIHNDEMIAWTEVALSCGYYDQSHFIKDFQSFSGISPGEYRPITDRHHNHAAFKG